MAIRKTSCITENSSVHSCNDTCQFIYHFSFVLFFWQPGVFLVHDGYVITLATKVNINGITIDKSCLNKIEALRAYLVLGFSLFSVYNFFDIFAWSMTLLVYYVILLFSVKSEYSIMSWKKMIVCPNIGCDMTFHYRMTKLHHVRKRCNGTPPEQR